MNDKQIEEIAYLVYGTKLTAQEYAFANMLIEAEREECARFLEETNWYPENNDAKVLAEKLRARGQQ